MQTLRVVLPDGALSPDDLTRIVDYITQPQAGSKQAAMAVEVRHVTPSEDGLVCDAVIDSDGNEWGFSTINYYIDIGFQSRGVLRNGVPYGTRSGIRFKYEKRTVFLLTESGEWWRAKDQDWVIYSRPLVVEEVLPGSPVDVVVDPGSPAVVVGSPTSLGSPTTLFSPNDILPSSKDGTRVPTNGVYLVDDVSRVWSIGTGNSIYCDGKPFFGGWGDLILKWKGKIYHRGVGTREFYFWDTEKLAWVSSGKMDPQFPSPVVPNNVITTGSIAAGSNILQVNDVSAFTQQLIDAGLCYAIVEATQPRGQDGPGGGWPELRYRNAAARVAALASVPNGQHCAEQDTTNVYLKWEGKWELKAGIFGGRYYDATIVPKALIAKVTGVNQETNTLTLSKSAAIGVSNAQVFLDGAPIIQAAIAAAPDGTNSDDSGALAPRNGNTDPFDRGHVAFSQVNLNRLFPNLPAVALGGAIVPFKKRYIQFTSDSRDSIKLFSPKGAPSASIEWRSCKGCLQNNFRLEGNWRLTGYGFAFAGSTVPRDVGYIVDNNVNAGSLFPPGSHFWLCSGCVQEDQTVVDVPLRASGGSYNGNCHARRVKNIQTDVLADYTQYQHQFDACNDCWIVDCEVDSASYMTGFELFNSTGGGIIRPRGRNSMISINNSGGWRLFKDPNNPAAGSGELRFNAGCVIPLEPYPGFSQYCCAPGHETAAVWINHNAGMSNIAAGGTVLDAVVIQEGYLSSRGDNITAVKANDQLPNLVFDGISTVFPAKMSPTTVQAGAVALKCESPALFKRVVVTGEARNQGNNFNILAVGGAVDGGGNIAPVGGKCINWQIS